MTSYIGAIRSDFSRFHHIRNIEDMVSTEFFLLAEYILVYEGATASLIRKSQEEEKARSPLPPEIKNSSVQAQEVSAEEMMASVMDGKEF